MIKLAIDAMGSDLGSKVVVKAIKDFLRDYNDVSFYVCGKESELSEIKDLVTIIHTDEVMTMTDGALEVMRKKNTSMMKAIDLVSNHTCDGVVSAGSTGAFLTGATIKLKMIEGVSRAALMSPFPTRDGKGVTILDIGANTENTKEHLLQFAKMGSIFTENVRKIANPKVYLLANGAEDKKGSHVGKEAFPLLKECSSINFIGNMEARDVLDGKADVVVCEGFSGNVLLKSIEGTASMMNDAIKKAFKRSFVSKVGYLFAKKGFDEFKQVFDYRKYGGAMLLGVNGVVVKGHGNSNDYAFYNAIRVAYEMVKADVLTKMKEAMKDGE